MDSASYARDKHLAQAIPLRFIRANPDQPRRQISEGSIAALAESIRRNGVIQPIVVRPAAADSFGPSGNLFKYELIAGERRWRAAQVAGLADVPAIIRDADENEVLELALVENIHREDLNAIDRAMAYQQLVVRFGLSPEQVGERTGEDRATVSNYVRLLELPTEVQDMVSSNLLSMGHARALLGIDDDDSRMRLAKDVVLKSMSVRALEDAVRQERPADAPARGGRRRQEKRPLIRDLERRFSETLQAKVSIVEGRSRGQGRIVIEYHSIDDFDRICEAVGIRQAD
jgi:ParB family chromosome partitioning protein